MFYFSKTANILFENQNVVLTRISFQTWHMYNIKRNEKK